MLAAGESRRLGRPKQLLPFRGRTLIHHAATTALGARLGPVTVVLGAHVEACRNAIEDLAVTTLIHAGWAEGLGSSIAAAARSAQSDGRTTAVLLTSCDQPDVTSQDLVRIAETWRRARSELVAAEYGGTIGIPALFAGPALDRLTRLSGDRGAKAILTEAGSSLVRVPCPSAERDVDTPEQASTL